MKFYEFLVAHRRVARGSEGSQFHPWNKTKTQLCTTLSARFIWLHGYNIHTNKCTLLTLFTRLAMHLCIQPCLHAPCSSLPETKCTKLSCGRLPSEKSLHSCPEPGTACFLSPSLGSPFLKHLISAIRKLWLDSVFTWAPSQYLRSYAVWALCKIWWVYILQNKNRRKAKLSNTHEVRWGSWSTF